MISFLVGGYDFTLSRLPANGSGSDHDQHEAAFSFTSPLFLYPENPLVTSITRA
jgi:hypothetical protein